MTRATKKVQKTPKKAAPKSASKKPKAAPVPTSPRTIGCKICKARIEFTSGLDEMGDHWETEHPDALAAMRAKAER